jgi:hypothetical protein
MPRARSSNNYVLGAPQVAMVEDTMHARAVKLAKAKGRTDLSYGLLGRAAVVTASSKGILQVHSRRSEVKRKRKQDKNSCQIRNLAVSYTHTCSHTRTHDHVATLPPSPMPGVAVQAVDLESGKLMWSTGTPSWIAQASAPIVVTAVIAVKKKETGRRSRGAKGTKGGFTRTNKSSGGINAQLKSVTKADGRRLDHSDNVFAQLASMRNSHSVTKPGEKADGKANGKAGHGSQAIKAHARADSSTSLHAKLQASKAAKRAIKEKVSARRGTTLPEAGGTKEPELLKTITYDRTGRTQRTFTQVSFSASRLPSSPPRSQAVGLCRILSIITPTTCQLTCVCIPAR